jgi:hypothetical protein
LENDVVRGEGWALLVLDFSPEEAQALPPGARDCSVSIKKNNTEERLQEFGLPARWSREERFLGVETRESGENFLKLALPPSFTESLGDNPFFVFNVLVDGVLFEGLKASAADLRLGLPPQGGAVPKPPAPTRPVPGPKLPEPVISLEAGAPPPRSSLGDTDKLRPGEAPPKGGLGVRGGSLKSGGAPPRELPPSGGARRPGGTVASGSAPSKGASRPSGDDAAPRFPRRGDEGSREPRERPAPKPLTPLTGSSGLEPYRPAEGPGAPESYVGARERAAPKPQSAEDSPAAPNPMGVPPRESR